MNLERDHVGETLKKILEFPKYKEKGIELDETYRIKCDKLRLKHPFSGPGEYLKNRGLFCDIVRELNCTLEIKDKPEFELSSNNDEFVYIQRFDNA